MFVTLLVVPGVPVRAAPPAGADPMPVRAVILVDESGSLTPEQLSAEKSAAALIAQSEFAPESELAVVGFASSNAPGQSPVDNVCPLTKVDSDLHRNSLAQCVQKLRRREDSEGNDTDFANALNDALSIIGTADAGQQKMIFLLTDGALDVGRSPSWGGPDATPVERNAAARQAMNASLQIAADRGVQVWPLGFGDPSRIDKAQLDDFAARGSKRTCAPDAPAPSARLVNSDRDVAEQLFRAFGAARCGNVGALSSGWLNSGTSVELTVDVPPISTDGSIAVLKNDPRISVSYFPPDSDTAAPKSGTRDGATYSVSGENSAVEVLRVRDPKPGRWRVRLTSGPDVPRQQVSAVVIWQANVRSSVTVSPPSPPPGESVTVALTVATRAGAVTEPGALKFLRVRAKLSGDGFSPVEFAMADDGKAPDARAGDGQYTGTLSVPTTATGALEFSGAVSGDGIADSTVPFRTRVRAPGQDLVAQLNLRPPARLAPGERVEGAVTVENTSGREHSVRVVLTAANPDVVVTLASPATAVVPPSGQVKVPVVVAVGAENRPGSTTVRVEVVDDADPAVRYDVQQYTLVVELPPPWWQRSPWWQLLVAAAVVVVLGVVSAVVWAVRRRRAVEVRDLVAVLHCDGAQRPFSAPRHAAREFRFIIRDPRERDARIDHPVGAEPAYVMTRDRGGTVKVRTPDGVRLTLREGAPEMLDERLGLSYRDGRAAVPGPGVSDFDMPGIGVPPQRTENSDSSYNQI
ncbi:vWA domain-containing protein [Virgisporangium aliadipatigenens]|nr:VWA domain-containing protein [Virgisporangium aliadipatigenens]